MSEHIAVVLAGFVPMMKACCNFLKTYVLKEENGCFSGLIVLKQCKSHYIVVPLAR